MEITLSDKELEKYIHNAYELTNNVLQKIPKPLVTIIISTFNYVYFISKCIEGSLIQNTTFPIEVVIHDDSSTDKTADFVQEYQATHPRLIKDIF